MSRRSIAAAMMAWGMLLFASAAQADTANILEAQHHPANASDGWQAGPCTSDFPTCSPETPALFFKQAGGHPRKAFVQFIVQHENVKPNEVEPLKEPIEGRVPETVRVDLPPGLSLNPEASPDKCSLLEFLHEERPGLFQPECGLTTVIGESQVNLVTGVAGFLGLPKGARLLTRIPGLTQVDLYNIEPLPGEPALFGFVAANSVRVLLQPEISWESDYHESFTIEGLPDFNTIHLGNEESPLPVAIHSTRLVTFGDLGDGTLATNPTTCFNADEEPFKHLYSSWIRQESFEEPDPVGFPSGTTPLEAALPAGVHPEGCGAIPFHPSLEVSPGTNEVDSPASPTVTVKMEVEVPARGGGTIAESHLRTAQVTLPEGLGLNPAGSADLIACTDAQFHKGQRIKENSCPRNSVLGTAEIKTPVLSEALKGNVYIGKPKSTDPTSGEEFRTLVEAKSDELDVVVRLIGNVKADPNTGQLTATFDEQEVSPLFGNLPHGLPQVPFESVTLRFDRAHVFSSPPTCSQSTTHSEMEPWSTPGSIAAPSSSFTLSSVPGGGNCPKALGQRAFAPVYTTSSSPSQGGSFSPFRIHIGRPDGQQEVKRLDLTLPRGLIGKLAGIPYCAEGAISAASSRSGVAEKQSPSCSAASMVGTISTQSGTGGEPLKLSGKAYLAGPYKGAPLSLVSITPAVSGPFDLGNVVVRVALNVDPRTAQITAVSDVIPDVFGGVKLDVRTIDFNLNRGRFTVNPTNCTAQATTGALSGGGANPTNPSAFSSYPLNRPFQATGCNFLGFNPKLTTTISGPTTRHTYPRLTTTLVAHEGDANIANLTLTLPHAFLVAQEHIATVCTRPQLASRTCPASSIYGEAEAKSPLLDGKLAGPVYLVPGGHKLPDLVADLHGQLNIQLHGVIGSTKGRIEAVFDSTPDVPVSEFALKMAGGKKGLIVNSTNICKGRQLGVLEIEAQNGKQVKNGKYKLNLASCKKHRGRKGARRRSAAG